MKTPSSEVLPDNALILRAHAPLGSVDWNSGRRKTDFAISKYTQLQAQIQQDGVSRAAACLLPMASEVTDPSSNERTRGASHLNSNCRGVSSQVPPGILGPVSRNLMPIRPRFRKICDTLTEHRCTSLRASLYLAVIHMVLFAKIDPCIAASRLKKTISNRQPPPLAMPR